MVSNISLQVLECGVTAMDFEMVAVGHPDKNASKHLSCGHPRLREGQIAHPVYAYIIEHPGGRILVDTGFSDTAKRDWKNNHYTEAMDYEPGDNGLFSQRLEQHGLKPKDFDDVIITHLHTDHAGNLPKFATTDARILLHEEELRGVVNVKGGMLREDLTTLWGVTSPQGFTRKDWACLIPDRATTLYGDMEIYRGIWTVSLPGHTWGSLGVAINLPHTGWVLLASDHIYVAATWGEPFVGNILNQDPSAWAQSAMKCRRLQEKYNMRIFPGHDNKIIVPDKDEPFKLEDIRASYD